MIVTQTPLRISFAGGGTDIPDVYRAIIGSVVSSAIDKYIYVIIKERFDSKIRVGYSKTEIVDSVDEIEHDLVRECLRKTGITRGVEVATMADIPSEGSGLGSSSSVTVGLLNAMYAYQGESKTAETLAKEACEIEIDVLGKPIGKQDQYIAAFGGLRYMQFNAGDFVLCESIQMSAEKKRTLSNNLMLFYTGITRKADSILREQTEKIETMLHWYGAMATDARNMRRDLEQVHIDSTAEHLQYNWDIKKKLAGKISTEEIDALYATAMQAGALGGKICGAGGGGFLMLYCLPEKQECVRKALRDLQELPFNLERDGSKVIFNARR